MEQRRRLQWSLLRAGSARQVMRKADARRGPPFLALEQVCVRLDYLILGAVWHPRLLTERNLVDSARAKYHTIASRRLDDPATTHDLGQITGAASRVFEPERIGH